MQRITMADTGCLLFFRQEGVEDGVAYDEKNEFVDLQPPTELARLASMCPEASLEASRNHTGLGDQSPIAIHAPFAREGALVTQDGAAGGYTQQDYVGAEIPSFVEAYNGKIMWLCQTDGWTDGCFLN